MRLFLLFSSTYTKLSSFIPIYILKVFIEGLVYVLFAWFIIALYIFATVDFNYNNFKGHFLKMSLFLHFSSTYIHQNSSFIYIYILKVFTEGFINIYFARFYMAFYS